MEREFFIKNLLVRIHLIIEMTSGDRPCAMGVRISFSRQPNIYLCSAAVDMEIEEEEVGVVVHGWVCGWRGGEGERRRGREGAAPAAQTVVAGGGAADLIWAILGEVIKKRGRSSREEGEIKAGVNLKIEEQEGGVVVQQRRVPQQRLLAGLRFRVQGSGLGFRAVSLPCQPFPFYCNFSSNYSGTNSA